MKIPLSPKFSSKLSSKLRILLIAVLGLVWVANEYGSGNLIKQDVGTANSTQQSASNTAIADSSQGDIEAAFRNKQSDIIISAQGTVVKVLPDDTNGSQHQRFIVKINPTQTILIAHNIDLAPRVNALKVGGLIRFKGEYEWNKKGGVVHWTHHDPANRHVAGWIELNGQRYQ
ncbi:DUF3465 domain-containing protein [Neptunomonas antarctica]|uniref:DUF3465 domain-containing protein n=1 Tax=Neptunomonas antarctica TaxID=619304 RepID=A0A1N7KXE4_9GAMM|nr:DUF3465 domain-containing protein [Neptunomonas antarctica]SIS66289.1 Protein of unknown function [Neptunomonas antarctica]